MTGQSHSAILFLLIMLMIGIAVWSRPGGLARNDASNIAWVCSTRMDSLSCFLASLTR